MFIPRYIHTHRECEWGNFPNLFLISFHSHSNALAFQACFFGISGELHHSPHTCHVLRHSRWVSYALWACWPLGGISQDLNIKHPIKVDEPYLTSQSTMECQLQLVQTTACHLRSFLERAMKLQCNGYLVNHPSQLQHECLILSGEDRIRFCLDQALLLVNWGQGKKILIRNGLTLVFMTRCGIKLCGLMAVGMSNCCQQYWHNIHLTYESW